MDDKANNETDSKLPKTADVVIIGGGIIGCSTLYNLIQKGVKNPVLLERDVIGTGSTGRSMSLARMHYSNEVTTQMALESLYWFKNFEELVGHPSGFVQSGYMAIVGPDGSKAMQDNVAMHKALGVNVDILTLEEASEIAPMVNLKETETFCYEPDSGYADAYAVAAGFGRRAVELGGTICTSTEVESVIIDKGKIKGVKTSKGVIASDTVLIATGPWSQKFFQTFDMDMPLQPVRHQVILIRRPTDLIPSHPAVADIVGGLSFRPDGSNLTAIGVGEEDTDLDTYKQGHDMDVVAESFEKLVARMPQMENGFYQGGWVGLFTCTPDWHPILDRVPGIDGLFCSVGFSGHGFKLSPLIGTCMAELILDGKATSINIDQLNINRFETGELMNSRYGLKVLA